jgi:hypothetical protein
MGERNPEDKLMEAVLTLQVLAKLEQWVADLDAGHDQLAESRIEGLADDATDLIDFRANQPVPSYRDMLRDCQRAGEDYEVSPEGRRRKFQLIQGESDEGTEFDLHGGEQEGEGEHPRPEPRVPPDPEGGEGASGHDEQAEGTRRH